MSRFDGAKPKHAVCPACRYHFGGIPVIDGALTCPECGHAFPLEFVPQERKRFYMLRIASALTSLILIVGLTLAVMGQSTLMAVGVLAICALWFVFMVWLRRSLFT